MLCYYNSPVMFLKMNPFVIVKKSLKFIFGDGSLTFQRGSPFNKDMKAFVFLYKDISMFDILNSYTRRQLITICKRFNIHTGKNKTDTVNNLIEDQRWNDGMSVSLFIKNEIEDWNKSKE